MSLPLSVWVLTGLALATGLVAGVFLTFSDFVMRSLHAADPAAGSQSMQIINRKVLKSVFMVLLIGLVPVSAALTVYGLVYVTGPVGTMLMLAGLLYFIGVFVVSVVGNIPMNNALAALPEGGAAAQAYWPDYVKGWVRWNHVRTLTSAGSALCLMVAALLVAQSS